MLYKRNFFHKKPYTAKKFADFCFFPLYKQCFICYNLNCSGPVVQSVSTPACHAGGRRFESVPGRQKTTPPFWVALFLMSKRRTRKGRPRKQSGGLFSGPWLFRRKASPFRVAIEKSIPWGDGLRFYTPLRWRI